ncbi:hypothetical protein MBLNU457_g0615t1 [Dothideomycetes sp. NU457]
MATESRPQTLVPPAVTALKESHADPSSIRGQMERSISQDIREEREDLKRAAEQSVNAIMDLNLDGTVRWISPSWQQITGVTPDSVIGKPVCDIILDNKKIFVDAVDSMRKDDTKSRIIRFTVKYTPPKLDTPNSPSRDVSTDEEDESQDQVDQSHDVGLEAQGIMVYDRNTGEESHTMWMIKPAIQREITIDLPEVLVESLGIGAHVLAQYLTTLAESGTNDFGDRAPPLPVLCRICERQITPWWFEKHTELCLQENRAEMEIQLAHESLTEHRNLIVKVLDALEAQSKRSRASVSDTGSPAPIPQAEYKGMTIGPSSAPTSSPPSGSSSGRASPAAPPTSRGRELSANGFGHTRSRSFAVRRPLARIVELVLDLCDTAIEINIPAVKDNIGQMGIEIRTQSPQSESRVSQVLQWQSPSAGTLDSEEGLSLLCEDTAHLSKLKVEAVSRHRQVLEYSERLRIEFDILVQECIDAAMSKAARIAAGELSDASDASGTEDEVQEEQELDQPSPSLEQTLSRESISPEAAPVLRSQFGPAASSLAMALRNASDPSIAGLSLRRASSTAASTRSNSPMGSKTPRSLVGSLPAAASQTKRNSIVLESDAGAESDSSLRSSVTGASKLGESPTAELSLSRVASTRGRKRTSLALPSLQSAARQESPARSAGAPPLSPLRTFKSRQISGGETSASPITSPIQGASEFTSPIIRAQQQHHRRQSSVALGESIRAPGSPLLTAISSNPQPKAVQTSIKDFEIIKPISKGAFGSVYLARKKNTGDYYAIKVLKKGDMVAKNQITNVKAERAIMMWQGESDFVAKLYWTFASKDYLYLVMEYLNGGDCASLIKTLGGIPEDWAVKYLAEVVLGVQHLHSRQIVHRDLKPDNLLIDQKGHLKLTDFGLSRMGLVGRQKRIQNGKTTEAPDLLKHNPFRRAPSIASSRSTSFDFNGGQQSPVGTPGLTPAPISDFPQPSYFSLNREPSVDSGRALSGQRSNSGESDALQAMFRRFTLNEDGAKSSFQSQQIEEEVGSEGESPDASGYGLQSVTSNGSQPPMGTPPQQSGMLPPPMALFDPDDNTRRFVGTPDYLAPETINGVGQDEMSDWWSLGCILFECLYGFPPFHAPTPEEVFQNILARDIHWPDDDDVPVSAEAKDLMNKLMTVDPKKRLGANADDKYENGGDEIRAHPWFAEIDWSTLREDEASFIPNPANLEDTDYFDARGASLQNFNAEFEDQVSSPAGTPTDYTDRPHDALSRVRMKVNSIKRGLMPLHIPPHVRDGRSRRLSEPSVPDDFGNFQFKNLPVLEKANKDVLSKLRAEAMQAQSKAAVAATNSPAISSPSPSLDASPVIPGPLKRALSANRGGGSLHRPLSPSLLSQPTPSPNRVSQPSSPLLVSFSAGQHHERRKTSSGSSSLSQQVSNASQPGSFFEVPRMAGSQKAVSTTSSPIKLAKSASISLPSSKEEPTLPTRKSSFASPSRQRAHTVGDQDNSPKAVSQENDLVPDLMPPFQKRKSQVFDVSPSSSDTEDQRQKALLRVQRRRQSSRRMSQITLEEGPSFRPLDVLICEDHPVSRLVMERLLEKLRCRTIAVQNGQEAIRYAMSEVKFDVIMMEFKLPQVNGADVARMIRETRNANSHTPMVAVTGYLKELQAPHDFDALIEKPPDTQKLTEVLGRLCQWKPPPPGWMPSQTHAMPPSNLRKGSLATDDSPTSTTASSLGIFSAGPRGSSRGDSITSGSLGEVDGHMDSIPVIISRQPTVDWSEQDLERNFGGLGISGDSQNDRYQDGKFLAPRPPRLVHEQSAPAILESARPASIKKNTTEVVTSKRRSHELRRQASGNAGDDEDEELGNTQVRSRSPKKKQPSGSSKLATEMLRTDSQGSVISAEEVDGVMRDKSVPRSVMEEPEGPPELVGPAKVVEANGHLTPPQLFPMAPGNDTKEIDMDATPRPQGGDHDPDPTPKGRHSPVHAEP